MATTVGSLLVALGLDSAEFKTGLTNAEKEFKRSTKRIESIGNSMSDIGKKMSLAVTAPLVALGVTSIKAAVESNKAIKSVEATLASMGARAGFTAQQLEKVASDTMKKSLYDDDEILQKVTNSLLTFGNVSGQTFMRAQQAAVDLSAKFGKDLQGSAIMVGKALQDPVKGLTALSRAGISFSPAQAAVIKSLVATGRAAEAQGLILKELERQVTGSAQAMRNADPMAGLRLSFGEFQEEIGKKLLPLLPRLTDALTKVLDAFGRLSPGMQEALIIGGALAAAFGPLVTILVPVIKQVLTFGSAIKLAATTAAASGAQFGTFTLALHSVRAALLTAIATVGPWVAVLGSLAAIYYLVKSRSDEVTTATAKYSKAQAEANARSEKANQLLAQMATANAKLRAEIIARAKADRQAAIQAREKAKADLLALRAETARLRLYNASFKAGLGAVDPRFASQMPGAGAQKAINQNKRNEEARTAEIKDLENTIRTLTATIDAGTVPAVVDVKVDTPSGAGTTNRRDTSGPTGPTAKEIEARFRDEQERLELEALAAKERLAQSIDERTDLQLDILAKEREIRAREIDEDEHLTAEHKKALKAQIDELYGIAAKYDEQGQLINQGKPGLIAQQIQRDKAAELERQTADLAEDEHRTKIDALQVQADLADTEAERKRIALAIFDAEQAFLVSRLKALETSETLNDYDKERARIAREALEASASERRKGVERANETQVERYLRDLNKTPEQINEAIDNIRIGGLESLNDALVDALMGVKSLGEAFRQVASQIIADLIRISIQQAIIKPLANMLFPGGGFGGGVPGFARGTNFAPGGMAIVGERGPELVNLPRGSQVIPNHELRSMGAAGGNTFHINMTPTGNPRYDRENSAMVARRIRLELNGMAA